MAIAIGFNFLTAACSPPVPPVPEAPTGPSGDAIATLTASASTPTFTPTHRPPTFTPTTQPPTATPICGSGPIALTSERDGNDEIYLVNADGSGVPNLTNDPFSDWRPYWSPDGSRIAFMSDRDGNDEIYLKNADGSGLTNLTDDSADDRRRRDRSHGVDNHNGPMRPGADPLR